MATQDFIRKAEVVAFWPRRHGGTESYRRADFSTQSSQRPASFAARRSKPKQSGYAFGRGLRGL